MGCARADVSSCEESIVRELPGVPSDPRFSYKLNYPGLSTEANTLCALRSDVAACAALVSPRVLFRVKKDRYIDVGWGGVSGEGRALALVRLVQLCDGNQDACSRKRLPASVAKGLRYPDTLATGVEEQVLALIPEWSRVGRGATAASRPMTLAAIEHQLASLAQCERMNNLAAGMLRGQAAAQVRQQFAWPLLQQANGYTAAAGNCREQARALREQARALRQSHRP
jgi:hypothetical protein